MIFIFRAEMEFEDLKAFYKIHVKEGFAKRLFNLEMLSLQYQT